MSARLLLLLLSLCTPGWGAAAAAGPAPAPEIPLRLYSDEGIQQKDGSVKGYVEVFRDGFWGSVCRFGTLEAAVACRQLGYKGGAWADYSSSLPVNKLVWVNTTSCQGTETSLLDCAHTAVNLSSCATGYAMVACFPEAKRIPEDAATIGGKMDANGVQTGPVYLYRHGIWGAICSEGFGGREAAVVCRELGIQGAASVESPTSSFTQLAWISNLTCQGTEQRVVDCKHTDAALRSCPGGYATVSCTRNPGGTPAVPIRLTGDDTCNSGQVEVFQHGIWGQVCAMDALGAAAVCRQLGLSGGAASVEADYTSISNGQPVWIANATCTGSDSRLLENCALNTTALASCPKGYAKVTCKPPSAKWKPEDMCTTPGPCQTLPGNCSASAGTCVYKPLPEGTSCPGGTCDGGGTCISWEDQPQWNVSLGMPFPYLDPQCWRDGACYARFEASGAARARRDNYFALVTVPDIGLSMVYDRGAVEDMVDIGRESISEASNATASALADLAGALLSSGNLTAVLADDLMSYLASGGPGDRWRRRMQAISGLPTPTLDSNTAAKIMNWAVLTSAKVVSAVEEKASAVAARAGEAIDSVKAGVSEAYKEVEDTVIGAYNRAMEMQAEVDAAGGAKRQAMCLKWTQSHQGYYAGDLQLTACEGKKATLSGSDLRGGPVTYDCEVVDGKPGPGNKYEYSCVNIGPNGDTFWGDGPSGPWWLIMTAGTLLGSLKMYKPLWETITQEMSVQDFMEAQQHLQDLDFQSYADYNSLFWPAGMFHDWCYHHNPITYGKTKLECDDGIYQAALAVCASDVWKWIHDEHPGPVESRSESKCRLAAWLVHLGVAGAHLTETGDSIKVPAEVKDAWEAGNTKAEYALPMGKGSADKMTQGKECAEEVPHCDLCYLPEGSSHTLCLACAPPYRADGKGDCGLVEDLVKEEVPDVSTPSCGSVYAYYQAFDLKCDFQCPPEQGTNGDWNLGCNCWDEKCDRIYCKLDSPQDDEQNPDVTWQCPVVSGRVSCAQFPELVAFLTNPNPPLSDAQDTEVVPAGQAYSDTNGYFCVLNTIKALVNSWVPSCKGKDCKVEVEPMDSSAAKGYVDYSKTGFQGEPRLTDDSCYVYSTMSKEGIYTTPSGRQLLLPRGTLVDYVGHSFETSCDEWSLVRISVPPAAGKAPPSYALAYMKESCLVYSEEENKQVRATGRESSTGQCSTSQRL